MDSRATGKKRQKRSTGTCWGCGREGVELVSSVRTDGADQRICDRCRKAVANNSDVDSGQVLTSRRKGFCLPTRGRLLAINHKLNSLVIALGDIGADARITDEIRKLVEPLLARIADDIWPKDRRRTVLRRSDGLLKAVPAPERAAQIDAPPEKPKKRNSNAETTSDRRARKRWADYNLRRREKGLPELSKPDYLAREREWSRLNDDRKQRGLPRLSKDGYFAGEPSAS